MHKYCSRKCQQIVGRRKYYAKYSSKKLATSMIWKQEHPERVKEMQRKAANKLNRNLKLEIIKEYGGYCVCCQETEPSFLSVDHIDGRGAEHRKLLHNTAGSNFYRWLRRNGYPKDNYQLLCMNCQFGKKINGTCPHQNLKEEKH